MTHAALSAVPSTLRIPLAARALGDAMFPAVAVGDAHAARMLAAMGDDGQQWLSDRPSVYGVLARTQRFRALARQFLAEHPGGHVVNLGCVNLVKDWKAAVGLTAVAKKPGSVETGVV